MNLGNLLKGGASVLSIFPSREHKPLTSVAGRQNDESAMREDFRAVGHDIRAAMATYEQTEAKHSRQ